MIVAIVGILAAVAIPTFIQERDEAKLRDLETKIAEQQVVFEEAQAAGDRGAAAEATAYIATLQHQVDQIVGTVIDERRLDQDDRRIEQEDRRRSQEKWLGILQLLGGGGVLIGGVGVLRRWWKKRSSAAIPDTADARPGDLDGTE